MEPTVMPEPRRFNSIDEFRTAHGNERAAKFAGAEGGKEFAKATVLASPDTEVKAGEGDSRTLTFTISSAAVDRVGDTIAVSGWKLESYRKNPVVLWGHDSADFPVARSPKIWIEGDKLKAEAEFVPKENPATGLHAEGVLQLYKQGFLSAVSVGFNPLKYAFTDDPTRRFGIDFMEQELLEFSCVTVPANAEALIEGRAAGINVTPMLDWCELQMKRCGDNARIVKLAEDVLGSCGDDAEALAWAKRIVGATSQLSILPKDRFVAITALVEEFRSDAKKALGSKGASGIYRRCANRIEKAITGEEQALARATPSASPEAVNVVAGFAEIAARRLKTVRHKTA
jgi:HK97 family phage prohead protease